jgi:uncharacterized iron-regulated membrane protein
MNRRLKTFIAKLHLWLGLISAPIVFFVCITGAIIVFADEIVEISAGQARFVKDVKDEKVPAEQILQALKKTYSDRKFFSYMVAYKDPERSIRFNTYGHEAGLRMVYVDPYTGEILKDDPTIYFFYIVAHLHNSLLLHDVGKWIIDIAVIVFILELVSGFILWVPRRWVKKYRKNAFRINFRASLKRINLDLHKIVAFYSLGLLLLLSFTGMLIAFESWSDFTIDLFGGDSDRCWEEDLPQYAPLSNAYPINSIIAKAFEKYPEKEEVQILTYDYDKAGHYTVKTSNHTGLKSTSRLGFSIFHKYSGVELDLPGKAYLTEKIENAIWVLHMGTWMGLMGKFITFLGGLIAASLPATGFFIWKNKRGIGRLSAPRCKQTPMLHKKDGKLA